MVVEETFDWISCSGWDTREKPLPRLTPGKFECIGQGRSAWRKKLNSAEADSDTPRMLPDGTYVLDRAGCSQAEDQFLREGEWWQGVLRRIALSHAIDKQARKSILQYSVW